VDALGAAYGAPAGHVERKSDGEHDVLDAQRGHSHLGHTDAKGATEDAIVRVKLKALQLIVRYGEAR
jgi:hypothetical protein